VRKKLVNATCLEPFVPARYKPSFEIVAEARCVPINELSLRGPWAESGPGRAYVYGRPHHAAADPLGPHTFQRRDSRVRGSNAQRHRREEPALPPNRLPDVPLDWVRGTLIGMQADYLWSKDRAISEWLERVRLNPSRGLRQRTDDPQVQQASKRYAENVRYALQKLQQFLSQATA
jgi:hypothetical protein